VHEREGPLHADSERVDVGLRLPDQRPHSERAQ
jgi:hypothetical protein